MLRACLIYLVFDDDNELRHLAKVAQHEDDVDMAEAVIESWYCDHMEQMLSMFAELLAERPFRWNKIQIVDEFASIELTKY